MGNIAGALNRVVEGYRELTDVGPASGSKTVDGKCAVAYSSHSNELSAILDALGPRLVLYMF